MNDIRRTILWVIFGFSLVLLWDQWQVFNGRNPTFLPSTKPHATATAPVAAPAGAASGAASSAVPQATPSSASGAGAVPDGKTAAPAASEKVVVTTDVLKLTFDTEGGSLVQSEFIQHDDLTEKDKPFVLLDQSANRYYVAQTGLIGGTFPTHKTPMTFTGERTLKEGANDLALRFESADLGGVKLVKTWTLKRGSYDMQVRHEIVNTGTAPVSPQLYLQIVRDGNKPPGESSFYSTFTGPAVYTDAKKYQKIEFKDIESNKADFVKEATNGYVAMVQHYFASAWLLKDGVPRDLFARKVDNNLYAVGMITPAGAVEPGASKAIDAEFFVGPQAEKTLEAVAPGLELVKDYGIFTIISKPLYWLLDKLHTMLGNWGWAIVALVVLLKAAFYWLNAKAYASMAKMKAINPKVMEMRERLKEKPQEMQQEMMRIYREEKVNPMGGCFPIVIQIPVFIALYWVLLSSVEMRHAPWIGWIKDLSAPDPWFILPIVMTATSLFQTWLNPTPPDPMQAKLMWIMPLAFSVMFIFFPAGLVLYWITNNVLSIAQQWFINKRLGVLGK
ncbi:membrane protein insertase YidC [Variovorax guangxiensis]|uniref:membrane protein insertase YidC n=1 Tax=Variovorax guangxiensis TaxID=1775474 RepID=UPI00285FD351|nr:membrane protein insertase YidC [Variovorax guangxiensis]MDR6854348.1 YidC/Oxa1 family membrane protein insertase [Variovorax guangxiensis]